MAPSKAPANQGMFSFSRNSSDVKWEMLFPDDCKEWIAFKPALGLHVYPCYSCRHMFYSKKSFLDHINRRTIIFKLNCSECPNEQPIFYNRCALLLHCRKHYNLNKGSINLKHIEISTLPFDLAGFTRHPDVPYLFDHEEEPIEGDYFINTQFYSPKPEDKGSDVVNLTPSNLMINTHNGDGEAQVLSLKQVAKNVPKCEFISLQTLKELQEGMRNRLNEESEQQATGVKTEVEEPANDQISISQEVMDVPSKTQERLDTTSGNQAPNESSGMSNGIDHFMVMPVITKVETIEEPTEQPAILNITGEDTTKCPECLVQVSGAISSHYLGENRPCSEGYRCGRCKLISPTACSYNAHLRIHDNAAPYVCPDCGIEFKEVVQLVNHMDEVCFHLFKSVRFRCPGRRCGKIFASEATFGPHFKQLHIDTSYMCSTCKEVFTQLEDCENHCLSHKEESGNILKSFSCSCCRREDMNLQQMKKHLDFHCRDLSRCIYIFMCKFCKCYFRSVQTMATHQLNCKVHKGGVPKRVRTPGNFVPSKYISGLCKSCKNKIICLKSKPSSYCNKCLLQVGRMRGVGTVKKPSGNLPDKCVCILCKAQIDFNERRRHQIECKYAKPQVYVEKLDINPDSEVLNRSLSSSDLDENSPQKNRSDSSDENRPRKRHKPSSRPRKSELEEPDLTAEEAIPFDGTYQCRLCNYKELEREAFHKHVKTHRHISTAYQCMECGECFVVKPSLVKHLLHYHNISDAKEYFMVNDCFDKSAVNELAKIVKAPYLANNVKENQCKVCLDQFETAELHNKHFRIHGMAFLIKNSI
ncbi:zinc finger protein 532-like [Euwallacea similis]|uniref:zinc finger protein 532-like n=1 Tax=Euwallacea similis TaxID=1736056 RepID=UPI00344CC7FB